MNSITPPLKLGDAGPAVANLQDALLALLNHQVIRTLIAPNRPTADDLAKLAEGLKQERAQSLFGKATLQLIVYFQLQQGLGDNLRGLVEDKTAATLNDLIQSLGLLAVPVIAGFVVRGRVRMSDGTPCAGVQVRAFDQDLRSREALGSAPSVSTKADGQYEIVYSAAQFSRAESDRADLVVEASQDGKTNWIASSIHFNAGPIEIVNITLDNVYRGPSEYSRFLDAITPSLDTLTLAELTENADFQDISFLSGDTGIEKKYIAWLADSAVLAAKLPILQQEEYYGLFRQNLPTDLDLLLDNENDVLRLGLATSSQDNIIRALSQAQLDDFVGRVVQAKAARVLIPSKEDQPASIGDLLALAVDPEKSAFIAHVLVENNGATPEFWSSLQKAPTLQPNEVQSVRQTLALGTFTKNYLPLVQTLAQIGKENATLTELSGFAQYNDTDWQALLQRPRIPGDATSPPIGFPSDQPSLAAYAQYLNQSIEKAYPVAVMANRIVRDVADDSPFKATKTDLLTFFGNNPGFSFTSSPELYLKDNPDEKLRDVKSPDELRTQLQSIKRLYNLTPQFPTIRALLADNLHSSTAIVRMGKRRFAKKHQALFGSEEEVGQFYGQAEKAHAAAANLFIKNSEVFNQPTPYVISGGEEIAATPDYVSLFGSLDLCDCPHCQSLYGPAAYLADILKFLRDGPTKNDATPLEILLNQRPDLEHIELTCDNTDEELPYIDLTNELLEAAVVARTFRFAEDSGIGAVLTSLNNEQVSAWIGAAFAQQGFALSDQASVRVDEIDGVPTPSTWIILDSGWVFTLKHLGTNEGFQAQAWPQTSWTPDELRANPEHVHTPAYTLLQSAVYPWNLPLNLPVEEMRTYFNHLGVPRQKLMEKLSPASADSYNLAREFLGFTPEEANIITGATVGGPGTTAVPGGPWDFWGLVSTGNDLADQVNGMAPHAQGNWDVVLQRVSIFLQQSGLSYKELLELLGTYFINPIVRTGPFHGRLLGIVSTDQSDPTTCDLSKLNIQFIQPTRGLNIALVDVWNKIHRFVRLWRKLGWTMRDLDKAMVALPSTNSDPVAAAVTLLKQLADIQRLQSDTRLPIVTLLSWWANIDTVAYIDQLADGEPVAPSLYTVLFSNKTVSGQTVGDDPSSLSGTLSDKAAAIAAALQIGTDDFRLLQTAFTADALSLANLSLLYRHATLAAALELSIPIYVKAVALIDQTPFASTDRPITFIKHVKQINQSSFSIEDLAYLLRNEVAVTSDITVTDDTLANALDPLRADLRSISTDNTFVGAGVDDATATSDPHGVLTRQKLVLLNWEPALIDRTLAVLNDTYTYEEPLATLASGLVFPDPLNSKLAYDGTNKKLQFTGTMTAAEHAALVALTNADTAFIDAVDELFAAPKAFVARNLARFSVPLFSVLVTGTALKTLLSQYNFSSVLKNKVYYHSTSGTLYFEGIMSESEHSILSSVSSDSEYSTALQKLFDAPLNSANAPIGSDIFLTSTGSTNDASVLFDTAGEAPQARFLFVLQKLLPYLRTSLSELAIKQRIGEYLKLDAPSVEGLLTTWIKPQVIDPAHPTQMTIADFIDPAFSQSNENIESSADTFPRQFNALRLLSKISVFVLRFKLTFRQLQWLFEVPANGSWLNLNALPVSSPPTNSLYQGWERLADLCRLRDALPNGEDLLTNLFTPAASAGTQIADLLKTLSTGAQWNLDDLKTLSGPSGFNFAVADFTSEAAILQLSDAVTLLNRLGASAAQCLSWIKVPPTDDDARALKSLVRSKYDEAEWSNLAKTLRDPLRERQRSALVSYLVQDLGVRGPDDLHDLLLIDVQMTACMMTTRIKQAICSVQLFIQRCFMNLVTDVTLTPDEAKAWEGWRKWYRVWEANRKVLFYPENWLEPELRDDKSPFFEDLENELLQSDVTGDTAEDGFLHYLEKLDQVSRLEVVGMYQQVELANVALQLPEVNIVHVFGRTVASPHAYFYRQLNGNLWSAWEKVDVDIEGDHLIPVVWNRRVHLFWPLFTEKSDQLTQQQRADNADPTKYWEIKFAWSQYKNGQWSPKKVSQDSLRYDKVPLSPDFAPVPQETKDFSFKTRIVQTATTEQLGIECYGTVVEATSPPAQVPDAASGGPPAQYIFTLNFPAPESGNPYPANLDFTIDGNPPWKSQAQGIQVEIRDANDYLLDSLTLDDNGNAALTHFVDKTVKCLLVSEDFKLSAQQASNQQSWNNDPFHKGTTIKFDLTSNPHSGTTSTGRSESPGLDSAPTRAAATYSLMGSIGEFRLDDANGDLTATPAGEGTGLSPNNLEPIAGTSFEDMDLVEASTGVGLGSSGILGRTSGAPYRLLLLHQDYLPHQFTYPFFFQDDRHTYFVSLQKVSGPGIQNTGEMLRFSTFYHPRIHDFLTALNRQGVDGLLTLDLQRLTDDSSAFQQYLPNANFVDHDSPDAWPTEDVDFSATGAYSLYNWELFFHAPFLIATQLTQNQRFEDAQKWFHYIFNPTATDSPARPNSPGPERFWRVKPLYETAMGSVQTLEALIQDAADMQTQIDAWMIDPLKPYVIARLRLVAYMKAVVMRYIDNLIAWGDQLFRTDTIESINEATQLYILASRILGRRPDSIPARAEPKIQTFHTLDDISNLDGLSNAVVQIESFLSPSTYAPSTGVQGMPTMEYFCVPANDTLLGYWDTVGDRLFKIRNCMNIEGVQQTLPIFEPPIDPGLLVRAAAAGVDIASALNDINASVPHYRFSVMMAKATELCNELKVLGGAMLAALEKRDAEALALLRSGREVELLKAVRQIKAQQVDEANNTLQGLQKYQNIVLARQQYYTSREFINPYEAVHIALTSASLPAMAAQLGAETVAGVLHLIPDTKLGAPTTDGFTYGGSNLAPAVQAFGSAAGTTASLFNTAASLSATLGGFQRRQDDWTHQADLATKELLQVAKQLAAAEIRSAIAQQELTNHDLQIDDAKEVDDFMREKYTNQDLYNWMVGQLSAIFFQSYQLAYDLAKRTERAFRYELGLKDSNFIQFGYWDSLKKGLLSGERLHLDLKRMDLAYLDQNKREYEITKHISLLAIDPISLLALKQMGESYISFPEALFDLDYPGHYMRRIKSIGITIPCVAGPYAGVNCTLTQLNSSIRQANTLSAGQYKRSSDDTRFLDSFGTVESIVTSTGQNDTGLFEGGMRDERYMPFEGQGAIGSWKLQLSKDFKSFDYDTISDVIFHVRYTARQGGDALGDQGSTELVAAVNAAVESANQRGLARSFSLRHEYPTDWYRFLNPPSTLLGDQVMTVSIDQDRFPFLLQSHNLSITGITLFVKIDPQFATTYNKDALKLSLQNGVSASKTALTLNPWNDLLRAQNVPGSALGAWTVAAWLEKDGGHQQIDQSAIEDIVAVCTYTIR